MSRNVRLVRKPNMTKDGVANVDIRPKTTEDYKRVIEKEYAPITTVKPEKDRIFVGVGCYLPKIEGKTVKINFSGNSLNRYTTNNKAIIDYLIKKGFKEVEL
jgi:hypothetical protein